MSVWYTALFTAAGEVTGSGYARKGADYSIVEGRTGNVTRLTWGPLTEPWDTVVAVKLFATAVGGDPLYSADTTQPVITQAGYRYRIGKGGIRFPEGLGDAFLGDEILGDQAELGTAPPPVELAEITMPPPSTAPFRVMEWARRPT